MPALHGEDSGPSQFQPVPGDSTYGVWGDSHVGYGVIGTSDQHDGVRGLSDEQHGVFGRSAKIEGVFGTSVADGPAGVLGEGHREGVHGTSFAGTGVVGFGPNAGVAAFNPNNNNAAYLASDCCAAYFTGNVRITGTLIVDSGHKSAMVRHPDGSSRLLYCVESPDSWFEDFGSGYLDNGQVEIVLDPDFVALVKHDEYHVFLTPYGDSNGLYVARVDPDRFLVREQQDGKNSLRFSYRVVARRRDVEVTRLEPAEIPNEPEPVAERQHRPPEGAATSW